MFAQLLMKFKFLFLLSRPLKLFLNHKGPFKYYLTLFRLILGPSLPHVTFDDTVAALPQMSHII